MEIIIKKRIKVFFKSQYDFGFQQNYIEIFGTANFCYNQILNYKKIKDTKSFQLKQCFKNSNRRRSSFKVESLTRQLKTKFFNLNVEF